MEAQAEGGRGRQRRFAFDAAFGPASSGVDVYAATAAPLVELVAAGGGNATCFCYGATGALEARVSPYMTRLTRFISYPFPGAGKTHTMLGVPSSPGIMLQALDDLFARLRSVPGASVKLAYLEIYNENVRDLLAAASGGPSSSPAPGSLELREDPVLGVAVAGLSYLPATCAAAVMGLLQRGNACRATEPTRCNATSSRSHAVLQARMDTTRLAVY